jgi:thioesterase domain-containing protein
MTAKMWQKKMHTEIPITKIMGVQVKSAKSDRVEFAVPLKPNRNHHGTAFGGTLLSMQALCAWTWIMVNCEKENLKNIIVVKKSTSRFRRPVTKDFSVFAEPVNEKQWVQFKKGILKWGTASIKMKSYVICKDKVCVEFEGEYVALAHT